MPLLRLSDGRIYNTVDEINAIVAPLKVGTFHIPHEVRKTVAGFRHPLSQGDAMYILRNFDPEAIKMTEGQGYTYRRIGNVVPSADGSGSFQFITRSEGGDPDAAPVARTPEEIKAYLTPHYVHVNDWHFVFTGGIIKGIQLEGDLQGIVYCQAGDWVRLGPTILNWPVFPVGEASTAVSCFDRAFDKPFEMELHPEVPVKPEVLF